MDRYEILAGKGDRPIAYRFKESGSPDTIYGYMKSCMRDDVMLDASTLKDTSVEEAVIRICKELGVPYVVATEKESDLLPLVHGYKQIFTRNELPVKARSIICGVGVDPAWFGPDVEIILAIINKKIDSPA